MGGLTAKGPAQQHQESPAFPLFSDITLRSLFRHALVWQTTYVVYEGCSGNVGPMQVVLCAQREDVEARSLTLGGCQLGQITVRLSCTKEALSRND